MTRAPVGGLWRHILDLMDGLLSRGFELGVVVDSLRASDYALETLERFRPRLSLGVHLLDMPRLPGLNDLSITRETRRLLKELEPDIVHGHSAKGGLYARLSAWGLPTKAAYTPHGGSLHYNASTWEGRFFLGGERLLMPLCDQFLFESRYSERGYSAKVGNTEGRSRVVFNGLAAREFRGGPTMLDRPAYDFAFAGEMRTIKGVDLFLKAMATLKRPDGSNAKAVLLGDGPLAETYRTMAQELGLEDTVTFLGRRPIREAFESTNTIVVPSRAESLPYIVMEAIAAGKRVIASDVGGIGEIFGPTRHALIKPDSVDALAAAMLADLDPSQREPDALLQTRYDYVAENFHVDTMVDQIAEAYRDLLG
ncbi:MAG: glycosyltransferase [Devosiaceae bacterium]|nr:glycosyltransferase [Devosiaceae bacterium MH13]